MAIRLLYPSSHWATNIGNPFFNLGAQYLLGAARKDVEVLPADLFAAKCFNLKSKYLDNAFNYTEVLGHVDAIVLAGPMFDLHFSSLFEPILRAAKESDTKVILLTTGGILYDQQEVAHCRAVLKKFPPFILTTRDSETYRSYHDLAENSYDGICTAWFLPEAFPGYDTPNLNKYITSCFDATSEPSFSLTSFDQYCRQVVFGEVRHSAFQKIRRLFQTGLREEVDGYTVVRPVHCCVKRVNRQLFFKPNSFVSQTPYGFLNLYRNTSLTLTDRLHAAVATMAYGKPARLYIRSGRTHLLNRVGVESVMDEITRVNLADILSEKRKYITWIKDPLSQL
jgi:Polysaccharide pyruvyl transferase